MAKLIVLGTCAGTEPMPGRHHTSFVIETGGRVYWFDAGECCSYTAHLLGVDHLKTRAVFISHPHMDHVGGLGNMLWTIRKLAGMQRTTTVDGRVDLYIPELRAWEGILQMLRYTEGGFVVPFELEAHRTGEGLLYEDENIRVTAMHNNHLANEHGESVSYSFRIETEGKTVVFSGDVRQYTEVAPLIGEGCDYLLMETGHHKVKDICDFADAQPVGKLIFVHNGRDILYERPEVGEALEAAVRCNPVISWDGMEITL